MRKETYPLDYRQRIIELSKEFGATAETINNTWLRRVLRIRNLPARKKRRLLEFLESIPFELSESLSSQADFLFHILPCSGPLVQQAQA